MGGNDLLQWHKLAESVEELPFADNQVAVVEVQGKKICVGRYKEQLYGFAYKCPHASGIMADGYIDALGNIVCPVHRYKFSLQTGRNTSGEGYFLKRWEIEIRENGVYVQMK